MAISEDEKIEAIYIAISKGYTCDGITGWRTVKIKSGKEIALRFGGV